MSRASNDRGRAFEFACLQKLNERIKGFRSCEIEKNTSYYAAQSAWNSVSDAQRGTMLIGASSAVDTIISLEPLIAEDGNDRLTLKIQKDKEGEVGDVRDILIVRRGIHWEIGLSVKHNHFAVKHSRLGKGLDFGKRWFGLPCSARYWQDVAPVFSRLECEKLNGAAWSELSDKDTQVYVPILHAFINEIKRGVETHPDIPKKMVEYLLGAFDFYKVISIDAQRCTQIQTFNLRGTLNKSSATTKPQKTIPIASLPTRLIALDFKRGSTNTVEMYLDAGWQFSFRIHNASTLVEPSLKFDVQIIGVPTTIVSINCIWRQ